MKSKQNTLSGRVAREQRQADAQVRAQSRALSTPEEQIAILALRPGASTREVTRLRKQVSA